MTTPKEPLREPHDPEAEAAVLGAVLIDNRAIALAMPILRVEDFWVPAHALVWEAMLALQDRGAPIGVASLAAELVTMQRLETVGGRRFLGELTDTIPTIEWVETHARLVADRALERKALEAMRRSAHEILTGQRHGQDAVTTAISRLTAPGMAARGDAPRSMLEITTSVWDTITAKKPRRGVPTPLPTLTQMTAGMQPGHLWTLAALTAGGKTSLAWQFARHCAVRGRTALVFSQEMPGEEMAARDVGAEAGIDSRRLMYGVITPAEENAITQPLNALSRLPILVRDTGRATLHEVRSQSLRAKQQHDLGLIVVDYLQILSVDPKDRHESRVRELEDITRGLKSCAMECGTPVLLLSQLNREPAKAARRPALSDLRGSGSIEQDSNVVLFLHSEPPEEGKEEPMQRPGTLIVAKQRGGPVGDIPVVFDRPRTRFYEPATEDGATASDARCMDVVEGAAREVEEPPHWTEGSL